MRPILLLLAACHAGGDDKPGDVPPGQTTPTPTVPGVECETSGPLLNEVSPSNAGIIRDVDGDSPDWIEIVNTGTAPVDLAGWGLSDDPAEGVKWTFPSLVLAPGALQVVYASDKDRAQVVGSWDTRIDAGDEWRYLAVTGPVAGDWRAPAFDDSAWPVGPSGFGYGDEDDETEVEAHTLYVRKTLDLTEEEAADLAALWLHLDYDDGFVAYINGVEVARDGIGVPGKPPAWDAFAEGDHEAELFEGGLPEAFALSAGALHAGSNTIAIEVHNHVATSVDLSLVPFLTLGFRTERAGRDSAILDLPLADLHTSFELSASGEPLRLYDATGCAVDAMEPAPLSADQSHGRNPEGALGYFMTPTPGAANTTEWRAGFAATPTFDPMPGWYAGGTDVTIAGDSASTIHYAMAGEEPDETDPTVSGPVATGAAGDAVVVRARAFQDGLWPSRIATGTYLIEEPARLPIVSVVTEPANLFDENTGIYVPGPDPGAPPDYTRANFQQDWTRPVHVEMWEPDGTRAFAVDGGVQIHGGYTRIHPQKSLLVELGGFGAEEITHDLFPGNGVESYDRFLLRAGGNDWLGCMDTHCSVGAMLRDPLAHALTGYMDIDAMASRPAEVYLNGEYWGIYYINERPDESYVADHYGEEDIDLLEAQSHAVAGDNIHWEQTLDYLRTHDLSTPEAWEHVQSIIDVEELASYLAFEVWFDNTDWPGNNVKRWRSRDDGKWRWMLYDTDFGLGTYGVSATHDSLAAALDPMGPEWPNPPWSTELFRLMMASPDFKQLFVNRYADHMNTLLAPEATVPLLQTYADDIALEIPRHVDRWGSWDDGVNVRSIEDDTWENEIGWIELWLERRPEHARGHVVANLGLEGTWDLHLDAEPVDGGTFRLAATTVGAPFDGVYFRGVPVTITALPAPGHTFAGWSDPSLPNSQTITIDPDQAIDLVAYFD